ncbi:PadR family transcriptional regulator [Natrarchaeobius halalkaliphilus]|uniref:PadR family transcriptional regulator n=1 Tax=Natrarchaeobius halalkaliphilus TaxID=1679091 RepID=A0A3N6P4B3_9EURY|nr:helix-turn-helix transcriptional regulator [Natrarchaeobius halalkaliphilus]RQG92749.1 PadR family transcriptional regulator [Natrarchaeobius halalkaliphilus]
MHEDAISTESVLEELSRAATDGTSESHSLDSADTSTDEGGIERELLGLLAEVTETIPAETTQFDEAIIKENLDEVLLMLITLHEETHGEELISDLARFFDTQLSPGTVYPLLHELKADDVLSMHAKVRTKEYSIADEEHVTAAIEESMIQHLTFGLLLYLFLTRA